MLQPVSWPRPVAAFLDERLARVEAACREHNVPFHDDAGVAEHLQRVLLASDFACQSILGDPHLLGADFLQLMCDPRHADARAGVLAEAIASGDLRSALRTFRRREALRLIWRDVNRDDTVETTLAGASVLAEACLEAALRGAEQEVATRHGVVRDGSGAVQRLVVFALGKLGGGELNFSSDVDLVFAFEAHGDSDGARPLDSGTYYARVVQALVSLIADRDPQGYVYRVDLRLRPFGNAGRPVLSFAAMEHYFQREGRDWERYAWIKARPVAGDRAAGARLLDTLRPFVFRRYLDYSAFAGLREMKALIDAEVVRKDLADDLKLGPGGIREIEFIVQLVQMIRGGREPTLRAHGLLPALAACEQLGFIPSARAACLRDAYRFLRRLENRLQMFDDHQTHEIPPDADARMRIALALDHTGWAPLADELQCHRDAVAEEFAALMALEERGEVERTQAHWSVFWRSLAGGGRIDADALTAHGFEPADEVVAALEALLGSSAMRHMSKRARERVDKVMPAVFAAAAEQSEPVQCLVRLLRLVHAVARRSVYLALLDEQPAALKRLSAIFSASVFLADQVIAHPLLLDELFDDNPAPLPQRADIEEELERRLSTLEGPDPEVEIELIQEQRQSALFRIGLAILGGRIDSVAVARMLSDVAAVAVAAVLRIAERELTAAHGRLDVQIGDGAGMAIIAYGSFGGAELGFSSDLDLVFLYDGARAGGESDGNKPIDGPRYYARLAQRVVHLLGILTRAGRLYEVDVRLRPDGSKGMIVQSLEAYESYQRERAWTWESQALVRARAVAGDGAVARRFEAIRGEHLGRTRDPQSVREDVIAMRARWRAGRDRSNARLFDLKQGVGGLVDIQFMLQGLVLMHAARIPALLDSGNSADLITAIGSAGLIEPRTQITLAAAHAQLLDYALRRTLDGRPRVAPRDEVLVEQTAQVLAAAASVGLAFDATDATGH